MFSRELCMIFSSHTHSTWEILGVSNYLAYLYIFLHFIIQSICNFCHRITLFYWIINIKFVAIRSIFSYLINVQP
jgi:hypothetical protein